jgi:mannose-6-phosphate isomerase-like protein (cupin superfamily)
VAFDGTYRRATERSKEELLAELDASEQATLKLFEGVAESQARFRQADGRWSLAEILDHLNATETMFLQNARKLSEDKHTKSVSGFEPGPIERLLAAVIANRNQRLNAPEPLLPKEAARPFAESLAEFRRRRQETKAFVRIAELRGARAVHPLGQTNLDAYQWMFTLAAHNRRHLEQAAEVMADPRYPGGADGLRRWSGLWQGAGKFNGKDVDIELSLKEQLGGKFNELNINIKTGPGTTFLGRAMYGSDDRASWSDSNGNAYPVVGRWDGGKFIAEWGDPVRGRSTYWVDTEGQLEVVDEVKRADGSYFGFGKYKLKRVPVNPSSVRDIRQTNVVDANSMTARVTNLAVGAKEELAAQDRDAFYFVEAGSGMLEAGSQQIPVQAGTIIHVQGGVVRRFHSIAHALRVLVVMPR